MRRIKTTILCACSVEADFSVENGVARIERIVSIEPPSETDLHLDGTAWDDIYEKIEDGEGVEIIEFDHFAQAEIWMKNNPCRDVVGHSDSSDGYTLMVKPYVRD